MLPADVKPISVDAHIIEPPISTPAPGTGPG